MKFEKMKKINPTDSKVQNTIDRFSMLLSIALISIVFLLYVFETGFFNYKDFGNKDKDKYFKSVKATVYSFEEKNQIHQTQVGNINSTIAYIFKYNFEVNGYFVDKEEIVNNIYKPDFILFLNKHMNEKVFWVHYDIVDPKNCFLITDLSQY